MSCVKTTEAVDMQPGMLSPMGPQNMYYMGCRYNMGTGTFGVCG